VFWENSKRSPFIALTDLSLALRACIRAKASLPSNGDEKLKHDESMAPDFAARSSFDRKMKID